MKQIYWLKLPRYGWHWYHDYCNDRDAYVLFWPNHDRHRWYWLPVPVE